MLIEVITFEIRDFANGTSESFMVADTTDNYEMIAAHRFTRQIQFVKKFDFQFEKEMNIPAEMISADTWLRMLCTYPEMFAGMTEEDFSLEVHGSLPVAEFEIV